MDGSMPLLLIGRQAKGGSILLCGATSMKTNKEARAK